MALFQLSFTVLVRSRFKSEDRYIATADDCLVTRHLGLL